jgi:ATP-dependent exoDNAse (exonuclease V) alpha subunit
VGKVVGEPAKTIHRQLGYKPLVLLKKGAAVGGSSNAAAVALKHGVDDEIDDANEEEDISDKNGDEAATDEETEEDMEELGFSGDAEHEGSILGSDGDAELWDGIRWGWEYNADNQLPYGLVVVDEASMLDVQLVYKLLRAIRWVQVSMGLAENQPECAVESLSKVTKLQQLVN